MPVGIDGLAVGNGFWDYTKLSRRWLDMWGQHFEIHGFASDVPLEGALSHIRIKVTSVSGAALITLFVHDRMVSSVLLLSGQSPSADREIAQMFILSLKRSTGASSPTAFGQVLSSEERPLMVVVHWPDAIVSEGDHELLRELALHMAGSFFSRQRSGSEAG